MIRPLIERLAEFRHRDAGPEHAQPEVVVLRPRNLPVATGPLIDRAPHHHGGVRQRTLDPEPESDLLRGNALLKPALVAAPAVGGSAPPRGSPRVHRRRPRGGRGGFRGGGGSTDGWGRYERWLEECVTPEEIALGLWVESPLPHPTVMMRRAVYERAGGYREVPWAEDYDLWLRMLRAGITMAKLREPLYEWADHPGRATRTLPAYAPEAFRACRAHHLACHLDGRGVIVWGAGRDGRRGARAMLRQGVDIRAFLDIDPKKVGRTAYGRPILAAEDWLATRDELLHSAGEEPAATEGAARDAALAPPIVLAAVGTAGARALIRARLIAAGLREGPDFLCIA